MEFHSGITRIDPSAVEAAKSAIRGSGLVLREIMTRDKLGVSGFVSAIRDVLPLDPPLEKGRSLDAIEDSMWGGIDGLGVENLVILWSDASSFEHDSPTDFQMIEMILGDLAKSLADPEATGGDPTNLIVLLV